MNQRLQRLADQIQRDLAVLIRDEINDPRLTGFVTISSVQISHGKRLAYRELRSAEQSIRFFAYGAQSFVKNPHYATSTLSL